MHVRISICFSFSALFTHREASDSRDAVASEPEAQPENALPGSVERILTALGPIGWLLRPGHHVINPDDACNQTLRINTACAPLICILHTTYRIFFCFFF